MSGHAGIYYFDRRPIDAALADRLSAGLASQGPDGGSEYLEPGLLMVYRAFHFDRHCRMERQPYRSIEGNRITFDGRLDNRDDLLLLLGDRLHQDQTDPALALAAYERWGEAGLTHLIGDWSLAIWDHQRRHAVLASDYMGVRPLFYYQREGFLAWSSSLSQLADWMGLFDELDDSFIASYLGQCRTNDQTVYRGVSYVSSGCAVTVDGSGRQSRKFFWEPPVDTRIRYRNDADYEHHLLHLFREAVQARLRTDGVVSCDLSGGLDSSSVTCMAHYLIRTGMVSPARLTTISLNLPGTDDDQYIKVVEQHCGVETTRVRCTDAWSLDQPAGPSPIWGLPIAREVASARNRESVRVSLTGHGGDHVTVNLVTDPDQLADLLTRGEVLEWLKQGYGWARAVRAPIWHVLCPSVIPLLPSRIQQMLWKRNSLASQEAYGHLAKASLISQAFLQRCLNLEAPPQSLEYRRAMPSQRLFLHSLELMRSTHGVTASPFAEPVKPTHSFYHRPLVEFSAAIPRGQLCSPGKPRNLMRRAFVGLLPPAVVQRKTKALSGTAMDLTLLRLGPALLRSPRGLITELRGYAEKGALAAMLRNPQATDFRRSELIPLLCLEVWFQTRQRHQSALPVAAA
jgi:hypothetical protein